MSELDVQQEFRTKGHSPKLWDHFFKPPTGSEEKNPFVALNDHIEAAVSNLNKWDDAIAAYEDQRDVSLEKLRENLIRLEETVTDLKSRVDKAAKSKKYIDLNQE